MQRSVSLTSLALLLCVLGHADGATYTIDPNHTHPMVELDHFGLSTWRGIFRSTHGTITLDRERRSGTVEVTVDTASIDFGHDTLNAMAPQEKIGDWGGLDSEHFPTAAYRGTLVGFVNGAPTTVDGELTLRGVAKRVVLKITAFNCLESHPLTKKAVCGADATGSFNRADFGVNSGVQFGFRQEVNLRIQVEAFRQE
jgi:polyisoprenoid-binding protein YceI